MTRKTARYFLIISIFLFLLTFSYAMFFVLVNFEAIFSSADAIENQEAREYWPIRSIDTMKFSRDVARMKADDELFDLVIEDQIRNIEEIGATHVAIGTPYDSEFIPFMKRWVTAARQHGLNVWFRGNLCGWEGWFDYPQITRKEHIASIESFILGNPDLFEDGDIFSSCPECENGGPGDPRFTGDVIGFRQFIVYEYLVAKATFKEINKEVAANYFSMNGDVAGLIMDKKTADQLDNIITIDHYVSTPEKLASDIRDFIKYRDSQVVLGEFGFPIPDIHGQATALEQADWLEQALIKLSEIEGLVGVNYWVNVGGSTALWNEYNGVPRPAAQVLKNYYQPRFFKAQVIDQGGQPISGAEIKYDNQTVYSQADGYFRLQAAGERRIFIILHADGYLPAGRTIYAENMAQIIMERNPNSIYYQLKNFFR